MHKYIIECNAEEYRLIKLGLISITIDNKDLMKYHKKEDDLYKWLETEMHEAEKLLDKLTNHPIIID